MAEPKFVPKSGQVDYTTIRYAPVVDAIIAYRGKILLAKRSPTMRLYPGYWHVISGFLDDNESIEDKVYEELSEELGIGSEAVESMERGRPLLQEAPEYHKTWLAVPVLVRLKTSEFSLNWESEQAAWYTPAEIAKLDSLPGLQDILGEFIDRI